MQPKIRTESFDKKDGSKGRRYSFRYKDASGERKYVSYPLLRDAQAALKRIVQEMESGLHVAKADEATVAEVADLFLKTTTAQESDGRIGKSNLKWKREAIKNHVLPHLGGLAFNKLTFVQVEKWYREAVARGLAPSTAKSYMRLLKQMEDFARKRKLTAKTVVPDVLVELRGVMPAKIETFTRPMVDRLLRASDERAPHQSNHSWSVTRCCVYLAAVCGLRYGEIMGLTVGNIDFEKRVLRIRHNLTAFGEHKGPKTRAGVRDFPLPQPIADMLAHHLRYFHLENDKGLVFRTATNTAIVANSFHQSYWRPLLRRAGLLEAGKGKTYHFHALRHFAASYMVDNGLSLPETARLLGHAKFDTTLQVYAHPIMDDGHRSDLIEGIASKLAIAAPAGRQSSANPTP